MSLKQAFTVMCFLLIAISINAEVPNTTNYQGRLTDASGNPVADGAYLVKFIIYDAPTAGTDLWNTGFQTINTVDGLFSYQLGSMVTLPNGIFSDTSRYLGITVGTDAELSPRSRFISSAYAFEAGNVAWSNISSIPAGFADGIDNEGLSQSGDTLKGTLYFDANSDGVTEGMIQLISSSANLALGTNGATKTFIWGNTFGEIDLNDIDGDESVRMTADGNLGGTLTLSDTAGLDKIRMFGNYTGNNSVQLPTNAIDQNEILDEPGIAGRLNSTNVITLDQSTTTMTDLVTVTITIPSAGYIYVTGHTLHYASGTTGANIGQYQIDETSGGGSLSSYYTWAGFLSSPNNNNFYQSVDVNRVYFKSAGTYTFRLEALAYYANSSAAVTNCYGSKIIAMYFPTSYGTVSTVSSQPPSDVEATLVQTTNPDFTTEQYYEYDLRDLELKAKEAQLKAQQAEMELMKAQQRQSRNQD